MRKTIVAAACSLAAAAPAEAANSISFEIASGMTNTRVLGAPVSTAQFGAVNDAGTIRTQQITVTRSFDRHTPTLFRALAGKFNFRWVELTLQPDNTARKATWCFDNLVLVSDVLTETGETLTFRPPATYGLFAMDGVGSNVFNAGYTGGKGCR